MSIKGIDIANYQAGVDLRPYKNQGFEVCYIKATEGTKYINNVINDEYNRAKSCGMNIGFYHFMRNSATSYQEAQHMKDVISKYSYNLKPCIDIEDGFVGDADTAIENFAKVFDGKENIIIYTGQ